MRASGTTANSIWDGWHYIVFTFENSSNDTVKSQNMVVYPDSGVVDEQGNWYRGDGTSSSGGVALADGRKAVLIIPGWSGVVGSGGIKLSNSKKISGQTPKLFPLQQNGGNAKFVMSIGTGGVVKESKIETGKIPDIT